LLSNFHGCLYGATNVYPEIPSNKKKVSVSFTSKIKNIQEKISYPEDGGSRSFQNISNHWL
jgi:hypothetical protein